jgi:two-component system cell cycle sensor histidine kinase/response regulator CckA
MGLPAAMHPVPAPGPSVSEWLDVLEAPAALLGADLTIVETNRAARAFAADLGAPGLRFVQGRKWADQCRQADAVGLAASDLEALLAGFGQGRGDSVVLDYVARRRGRFKTFHLTARTLPGASGRILVIQTDVTRLGVTEQRLQAAEQRLADIAELSSDWLWAVDDEFRFVEATAPTDPFWRRVQPGLIGRGFAETLGSIAPDLARHRPFRDIVAEIEIEGAIHRIRFSGKPVFDVNGGFQGYAGLAADITRAYESEHARDAAERRLQEIAELSSDWYWETDSEFRFTYLSDAQQGVIRLGHDQTIGRRRIDMIDRSLTDPEALAQHISDLENHLPFRDFIYGSRGVGHVRYLKISGKPRFDAKGKFLGHVGTATDVTAVVEAEKRREAAESRLKAAVEHMPGGIAIWDAEDRLVVHNEQYVALAVKRDQAIPIVGYTFEEIARGLLARGIVQAPGGDGEAYLRDRLKAHRNPGSPLEVTYSNGRVLELRERRLPDGTTVTVTSDITALKARERMLAEQRGLLQTTLDHISDGILAVDKEWRIVAVNDTFASLLAMPGDVARVGAHLATVIEWLGQRGDYGSERANVSAGRVIDEIASRPRWYDERQIPDGRQISWRVREMQGGGRVIAVADVSEQRQAEQRREQLRSTMAQAQQLEAISRLAGGLAHDLNNMLLPVMTLTELAMDELPEGSPARGDLERVIGAAEHARGLVQRLLTFSRSVPQPGGTAKLDSVARAAADLIRATAGPDLSVKLDLRAAGISIPLGDTEVQQIVMNLGLNAAQAIGDRKGTLSIATALIEADDDLLRANPSLDSARRYARLTVTDDGPGIPADVLPRIFDPFFTTKAVGQGTGLGLAVVHGLVSQVGGAIEVNGEGGAKFDILLPVIEGKNN